MICREDNEALQSLNSQFYSFRISIVKREYCLYHLPVVCCPAAACVRERRRSSNNEKEAILPSEGAFLHILLFIAKSLTESPAEAFQNSFSGNGIDATPFVLALSQPTSPLCGGLV